MVNELPGKITEAGGEVVVVVVTAVIVVTYTGVPPTRAPRVPSDFLKFTRITYNVFAVSSVIG